MSSLEASTEPNPSLADAAETRLPEELWAAFFEGDRKACARLITRVENDPAVIPQVRDVLSPKIGGGLRIGVTGPPGVGKSTLSAVLAEGLADLGHRVGIVAVDPSSPFTGGAFMGDRVRMDKLAGDERIYIRSLASREGHGGLSPSTPYVADVIEGFGMDRILIETVGVGQAELDVMACTDLVVLVLQPATGDAIQALKAGIIEAADLIVVNKTDLPGVNTALQALRFLFSLGGPRRGKPIPPIISTSAQKSQGLDKLVQEVERLGGSLVASGQHQRIRTQRMEQEIRGEIQRRLWVRYDEAAGASEAIAREAARLIELGGSPYPYVREACSRIELAVRDANP